MRSKEVASCGWSGSPAKDDAAAALKALSVLITSGARYNQVAIRTSEAILSGEAQGRLT